MYARRIYETSSLLLTLLLVKLGFSFPLEQELGPGLDDIDPIEVPESLKPKIIYGVKYNKVIFPDGDYELF